MNLPFERHFTKPGTCPFHAIKWTRRTARIKDDQGRVVFEQEGFEVPEAWSQLATDIVASKYAYGKPGTPERETSVRQIVERVVKTISRWAREDGYLGPYDRLAFEDELAFLLLNQYSAFNSPVWFNVGVTAERSEGWVWEPRRLVENKGGFARAPHEGEHRPQGSACFIQSVQDTMESIMDLARSEAMLFKRGSGTGTDLSTLRSSKESLSGGGRPSGPMSFLRVFDRTASVVKSGGKTRRAAKMNTLHVTHPDILEFIDAKREEEKKARALIAAGYPADFNGPAYDTVAYQNANLSVRASDDFMRWAESTWEDGTDDNWFTTPVTGGPNIDAGVTASQVLDRIAEGTWACGDPGMQFDDTINSWHTCPNSGRINSSNPCSEYLFLDDSACNLASINLMKFRREDGTFDVEGFRHTVRVMLLAQEVTVSRNSYPTAKIAENSHKFRPLGLGYANLGALLMSLGLPYDSDEGRDLAAAITAIMHAEALLYSSKMAEHLGPFEGFAENREAMLAVVKKHRDACYDRLWLPMYRKDGGGGVAAMLAFLATSAFDAAMAAGECDGFRNAQVTLLAPTGTIAFMMDCDTTGIEPDIALVKYKNLAGGGQLRIVNQSVALALKTLGYDEHQIDALGEHLEQDGTLETHGGVAHAHLPVFDCAFAARPGGRSIPWQGHVRMMAAVQPFLSGAISKTVNMPPESSVQDIREAYILGWKLGLKALAIYRDGSKESQPLNTTAGGKAEGPSEEFLAKAAEAEKLQEERDNFRARALISEKALDKIRVLGPERVRPVQNDARRVKFRLHGNDAYLHFGLDVDGRPREVFATLENGGSTETGMTQSLCKILSVALQHGVPMDVLCRHLETDTFAPNGPTGDVHVPFCQSIPNYLGRKMRDLYPEGRVPREEWTWSMKDTKEQTDNLIAHNVLPYPEAKPDPVFDDFEALLPASRLCGGCGSPIRLGGCVTCTNCGTSNGACG